MFPHVSTEALVCALVLSEEGNLGRTAERLNTSQANAGRRLKALQTSWEIEFFRRIRSGFELTEHGRTAMRDLRIGLEHLERAFSRASYSAVRKHRPFRIGHSLYIHGKVLPFLQRQGPPGMTYSRVILRSDTTMRLVQRVLRGELHVGFGVMPILDNDLWVAPVAQESFSACIPDTHPLKDRLRISARDLANEKLYWVPRSVHPAFYGQITTYLAGVGHQLRNIHEGRAIIEGIDLAAHNFGVALVPQSANRFQRSGVLFKPLTDKLIRIETVLFARRDQMYGDLRAFVDAALAELQPAKTELQ
jgi:DNA-binding transcriptional LysR family regulator